MALPSYDEVINNSQKDTAMPSFLDVTGDNPTTIPSFKDVMTSEPRQDPTGAVFKQDQDNVPSSTWNSLTDNPIVSGTEVGLSWLQKPFQSVSTGIADTAGAVKNLVGSEKRMGFDGNEYVSTPSESRNLLNDLKSIWSQTNSDTSSEAWRGAFPNLGKMKGTDVNWTDALDFGAQAAVPLDIAPLLKASKIGVKGLSEAGLASKAENILPKEVPLPDYSNVRLSEGRGNNNPSMPSYKDVILNADSAQPEPFISKTLPPLTDNYVKPLSNYADTMYRETSPQNALDLIPGINSFSDMKGDLVYFANNKDLALGQGTNKGVMIEVDPNKIQGQVNRSKPNWETVYNNGDAEFIAKNNSQNAYKDAVKSVTIQPNATMDKVTKIQLNRALSNWDKVNNPDGSVSYLRPKDTILNSDAKDLVQLTPAEIARNERIDQFSKVEDNPIIPNTADQIQSKTGRDAIPLLDRANDLYIKTVDNAHRTNQFDQAAAAAKGGELNPSDSAYMLQLNARGHDMQSSQIVNKNMIDAQGNVTGQSLADITKQIPKGQEQAFNDYVVAQHSIDRMGRGEQVYSADKEMTVQKAKAIVDQYNATNPEFKAISEKYTKFHQEFAQQWYVDTGLFKQSQLDLAKEANPNYVPNKRIFSDIEQKTAFNSKGGVAGQTNPVKRYDPAGSQRPIVSPIESSIEDIAKGVKTARNNEAGQAIVRSLQRNPDELSGFAEIVHDQPKLNVDEMLQKDGMEGVIDHINKTFEDATKKPNGEKGNVVTVLVNGEPVHVRVYDPQFLEAISNLSPKGQDYVTAVVGKATKVMKNLTTGINPIFGLTRNVMRDIPHGYVASKTTSNPIRYGADLVDGLTSVLADSMSRSKLTPDFMKGWLETRGQLYNDYKNMGGGHSSPTAADRNLLAQTKEKILPSTGIGQTLKRNLITKPYHALENLNNATEAAPRLGEYKRVVNQGGGTYDAKVKGLYEANNLTVNFNKFGNVTKNVDAYIPYLNAAVQGLDQVAKLYTQGGAKRLTQVYAKSIGALTIPTAVLYMINHDNPDYQQVSNFVKDNNLLIPNGDGTFTKIPKPREMGMIFSTGVERALRAFNDHDPRAFQDFAHNFLQNFLPPGAGGAVQGFKEKGLAGIPSGILGDTIAGPIQSIASNKDFANRDIVPRDLTGLSPELQYDSKTSEVAKLIGHIMNSSPKQLDYLAKSYGGVLAQLGIPLTTKGGSLADTLKQQVTVDPAFSNDISRNFYDQKVKADTAKADSKFTGEQKDNMSKYYNNIAARFTNIRKQMKRVQNDDSLSNTEKRAQLRGLQQSLNDIQQQATQ